MEEKVTRSFVKEWTFFSHFPTYSSEYSHLVNSILTMKNLHVLVLYDTVFLTLCCTFQWKVSLPMAVNLELDDL